MNFNIFSTFRGGIHPAHNKHYTEHKAIEIADAPETVVIPLHQHIGAPCNSLVKPGDTVKMGQKIGQPQGYVSAPVHSSVSGKVKAISPFPHPLGGNVMSVMIENDGLDTLDETVLQKDYETMTPGQIRDAIFDFGIVGMGGAAFPTHVKLSPPPEKKIDMVILNGAECEPYLTADHRLMLEKPEEIVKGLRIIMKVLGVNNAYIGIEDNKSNALEALKNIIKTDGNIKVVSLKTKYPQGAEKQLIDAITGRKVPSAGLPMDIGVVVNNVGTAAAISMSFNSGMPLIERIVTVSGSGVKEPKNLRVRIGTPFSKVIEQCGGMVDEPAKVISGGPMMGLAQYSMDVPVIKGTSGILVLTRKEAETPEESPCIRCGKCVEVCPINLVPLTLSAFSLNGDYEACSNYHALDCIECGSCSYICPAKRPLLQSIRVAKSEVIKMRKQAASK